jgi:hypothetical protein
MGRDSSVGIATRYGLEGPGIESRWGARFSAPVQTGRVAHPASYTMGIRSSPRVKLAGLGVDHPPPSGAEVKERAELYLYTPFGPSWLVLGWSLRRCIRGGGKKNINTTPTGPISLCYSRMSLKIRTVFNLPESQILKSVLDQLRKYVERLNAIKLALETSF